MSHVLLSSLAAGEETVTILSPNLNVSVEKAFMSNLGESPISDGDASFTLPGLGEMGMAVDENDTANNGVVDKQVSLLFCLPSP